MKWNWEIRKWSSRLCQLAIQLTKNKIDLPVLVAMVQFNFHYSHEFAFSSIWYCTVLVTKLTQLHSCIEQLIPSVKIKCCLNHNINTKLNIKYSKFRQYYDNCLTAVCNLKSVLEKVAIVEIIKVMK